MPTPKSKIGICNLALAHLGADSIRSFEETNKRARMADVFFDQVRDYLLSKFDWPFARRVTRLKYLDLPDEEKIPGLYPYQLPADCRTPRELYPRGSKNYWEILGDRLWCKIDITSGQEVILYYTVTEVNPIAYSDTFVALMAILMAIRMAPPLTQDKALTKELFSQYQQDQRDAWESDANIGNSYREFDETPENDSFVNPDGWLDGDVNDALLSS